MTPRPHRLPGGQRDGRLRGAKHRWRCRRAGRVGPFARGLLDRLDTIEAIKKAASVSSCRSIAFSVARPAVLAARAVPFYGRRRPKCLSAALKYVVLAERILPAPRACYEL